MDETKARLITCFQTVFPDLSDAEILVATQQSLAAWDSIAAITLVNVIEDEFQIQMDLDQLAELDSFDRVEHYLQTALHPTPVNP